MCLSTYRSIASADTIKAGQPIAVPIGIRNMDVGNCDRIADLIDGTLPRRLQDMQECPPPQPWK